MKTFFMQVIFYFQAVTKEPVRRWNEVHDRQQLANRMGEQMNVLGLQ